MNNLLTKEPFKPMAKQVAGLDMTQIREALALSDTVRKLVLEANGNGETERAELEKQLADEKAARAKAEQELKAERESRLAEMAKAADDMRVMTAQTAEVLANQRIEVPNYSEVIASLEKRLIASEARTGAEIGKIASGIAALGKAIANLPQPPTELEFIPHHDGAGNVLSITARGKK